MPNTSQILQPRSGKSISIVLTPLANHKRLLKARYGSIDLWIIVFYLTDTDQSPF